jgi:hypothetical protein
MQKGKVYFTDDGVAKHVFSLPRTATLLGLSVQVVTGFNDSGTDLLRIGTVNDDNYFVADFSVANAGYVQNTLLQGGPFDDLGLTGPTVDFQATYNGQHHNSTAGELTVIAVYADPFTNPA